VGACVQCCHYWICELIDNENILFRYLWVPTLIWVVFSGIYSWLRSRRGQHWEILEDLGLCTEQNVCVRMYLSLNTPTLWSHHLFPWYWMLLMFMYNGILCNLQNCNDSSERGATRALLLHLWEGFWILQRDVMEMGKYQRCRHQLGSMSYVNMLARWEEGTMVKRRASQAKNQANIPLTAVQQSIYNQHRLGMHTWKTKQGATTTGLQTRNQSTRAQRKMERRGPPRLCENCVHKTRWSRQPPHDMFLAVTRTRVPLMCEGYDNEAAHSITFESLARRVHQRLWLCDVYAWNKAIREAWRRAYCHHHLP